MARVARRFTAAARVALHSPAPASLLPLKASRTTVQTQASRHIGRAASAAEATAPPASGVEMERVEPKLACV